MQRRDVRNIIEYMKTMRHPVTQMLPDDQLADLVEGIRDYGKPHARALV